MKSSQCNEIYHLRDLPSRQQQENQIRQIRSKIFLKLNRASVTKTNNCPIDVVPIK